MTKMVQYKNSKKITIVNFQLILVTLNQIFNNKNLKHLII